MINHGLLASVLLGGVPGVAPAKVVMLGGGDVGQRLSLQLLAGDPGALLFLLRQRRGGQHVDELRQFIERYERLADAIRSVLKRAIRAGGTTLRDYYGGGGESGWFQQELDVYGREDEPCNVCDRPVTAIVQGQRATYYCKNCQS